MKLSINNFEIIIADVAELLEPEAYKVYAGLLEFVETFGREQESPVAAESLYKLERYLNENFVSVIEESTDIVQTDINLNTVTPFNNNEIVTLEMPNDLQPTTEFEFIEDAVFQIEDTTEDHAEIDAQLDQIRNQMMEQPEYNKGSIISVKPEMLTISTNDNPGFFEVVSNLATKFKTLYSNGTKENATDENTQHAVYSTTYDNDEKIMSIEIMKTEIPNIFPEQMHIIHLIRAATGNRIVTKELVTLTYGSMNAFCKEIANQSMLMYKGYLERKQLALDNNLPFTEVCTFGHGWQTVRLLLLNVISYDAITFEISK